MERVKEIPLESRTTAPPPADEQPILPEQKSGPHMSSRSSAAEVHPQPDRMVAAMRTSELLASPEGDFGAPTRARMGSMLQRQVGNARLGRTLDGTVQAKRTVGSPDDVQEQDAERVASEIGKTSAATRIQRQQAGGSATSAPASTPSSDMALTPHEEMVTASLLQTLERFKNIPIFVGIKPLPPDLIGPPEPVIVNVHAQYANNKFNDKERKGYKHYRTERELQKFDNIVSELEKRKVASVLKGKNPRFGGMAVKVGKAAPEDIKAFVEEAISQGIMEQYAIATDKLEEGQKLVDLPKKDLEELIQGWMEKTGVGLDCNGFVQQALIQVREEERAAVSAFNSIFDVFGIPLQMPAEIEREDISVSGFKTKEIVKTPTELRPGDAWVITGPDLNHIRIVTSVREVVWEGKPTIEFYTAESTPSEGPVAHRWHTGSMKKIGLMGTFHHVLSSDKLTAEKGSGGAAAHHIPASRRLKSKKPSKSPTSRLNH